MQTPTETPLRQERLDRIATILRLAGFGSLALEILFGAAGIITLLFAISGRSFTQQIAQETPGAAGLTPGLGIGVFWAVCGLAVLLYNAFIAFRLTLFARRLRNPNASRHPRKAEVVQVLKLGIVAGLIGTLFAILGGGATLGTLLAKTISLPQVITVFDPARAVRSLDIFVALANMNAIAANFVAIVSTLGLFEWLERQHR